MDGDEKPDKIGGTARIVHYRLTGALDEQRWDIVRRSRILAPLPLDRPQPGPAWVINLKTLKKAKQYRRCAIEQWEPQSESGQENDAGRPRKIRLTDRLRQDFDRLWLASEIGVFNRKVRDINQKDWEKQVKRAGDDEGAPGPAPRAPWVPIGASTPHPRGDHPESIAAGGGDA